MWLTWLFEKLIRDLRLIICILFFDRMCRVTWSRFPSKKIGVWFDFVTFVKTSYLNTDCDTFVEETSYLNARWWKLSPVSWFFESLQVQQTWSFQLKPTSRVRLEINANTRLRDSSNTIRKSVASRPRMQEIPSSGLGAVAHGPSGHTDPNSGGDLGR